MSDKLSDERREHLEFIERCDPAFLIMHLRNDTAFNADALESVFQLAKERARELLAASPAPAITMPPLNDAMRAVLTNENCIYGTPDELYVALVKAASAISESDQVVVPARVVELLRIINRDGVLKRATELQEVYRLVDAARKGEKS
ncbi:hypothetical protein [Burkholderia gladioli]|uniref:hypothetical protein n=1 Tax=Burkholderia gladioli TaxID=28095 RepID=UPI001640A7C8|nr:hypothetical protein [Burkholderia gladioli]